MDYQTLIVLDSEEEANEIISLLKMNSIDSYVEESTQYDKRPLKFQWDVMVDKDKAGHALLCLSLSKKFKTHSNDSSADDTQDVDDVISFSDILTNSSSSSYDFVEKLGGKSLRKESKGCSSWSGWAVIGLIAVILWVGNFNRSKYYEYKQQASIDSMMKSIDRMHKLQDRLKDRHLRLYTDKEGNIKSFVTQDLTLDRLKETVERYDKSNPQPFGEGFIVNKTKLKGKVIYYDIQSTPDVYNNGKNEKSLKKILAKNLNDNLGFEKFVFGNNLYEKMDEMGVSFIIRLFDDKANSEFQNIAISPVYLKRIDDKEKAGVKK